MSDADKHIVDAMAAVLDDSSRWRVYENSPSGRVAMSYELDRAGWLVFRDEADAEAAGWVRRGP